MFEKYNSENGRVFNDGRTKAHRPLTNSKHFMNGTGHGNFWHIPDPLVEEEEFINPFVPIVNAITVYVPVWLRVVADGTNFSFEIYNGSNQNRTQIEQIPQQAEFRIAVGDTTYSVSDGSDPNEKIISTITETLGVEQDDGTVTVTDNGIVYKTSITTNADDYTLEFDNSHTFTVDYEPFEPCERGTLVIPGGGEDPFCDCPEQPGDLVTYRTFRYFYFYAFRSDEEIFNPNYPASLSNRIFAQDDGTGTAASPQYVYNEQPPFGWGFSPGPLGEPYSNLVFEVYTGNDFSGDDRDPPAPGQGGRYLFHARSSFVDSGRSPFTVADVVAQNPGNQVLLDAIAAGELLVEVDPFNNDQGNICGTPPPACPTPNPTNISYPDCIEDSADPNNPGVVDGTTNANVSVSISSTSGPVENWSEVDSNIEYVAQNPVGDQIVLVEGANTDTLNSNVTENIQGNVNLQIKQQADVTGFEQGKITIGSDLTVDLIATATNVPMQYHTWGQVDDLGQCHFIICYDRRLIDDSRAFESFTEAADNSFSERIYTVVNQLETAVTEPLTTDTSQANTPIYDIDNKNTNRDYWTWNNVRHVVYDPFTDTVVYDRLYQFEENKETRFDTNDPPQPIDDFYLNDRILPDIIGKHHDHIDFVNAVPTQNTAFWNETDFALVNAHNNFVQPTVVPPESPTTDKYEFGPWYTNTEIGPPLELIVGTYNAVPDFNFNTDDPFTATLLPPTTVRGTEPPDSTGSPDTTGEANGVFLLPWRITTG